MSTETKLRTAIYEELGAVTKASSPFIHNSIQNPNGYKEIEEMIINNVVEGNLPVQAAIPQVEMQLQEIYND